MRKKLLQYLDNFTTGKWTANTLLAQFVLVSTDSVTDPEVALICNEIRAVLTLNILQEVSLRDELGKLAAKLS